MTSLTVSELDQVNIGESSADLAQPFNLAIIAIGRSDRHSYILSRLPRPPAVVYAITTDQLDEQTVKRFEKQFGALVVDISLAEAAILTLTSEAARQENSKVSIFVDVSCLSRTHMGSLFSTIKDATQSAAVRLSIGYCLARYSPPPDNRNPSNRKVSPVHPTFSGWTAGPHRPVDVVVSLGYEKGKALGAVEYLEPNRRWIFVPNSPETKFLKTVRTHNRELTSSGGGMQIDYEVLHPLDTYFGLLSLVVGLRSEVRPVLLPFGPRIFFAISLLVAMTVEEAAVWHVDGDDDSSVRLPQSSGHAVVLSCSVYCPAK